MTAGGGRFIRSADQFHSFPDTKEKDRLFRGRNHACEALIKHGGDKTPTEGGGGGAGQRWERQWHRFAHCLKLSTHVRVGEGRVRRQGVKGLPAELEDQARIKRAQTHVS